MNDRFSKRVMILLKQLNSVKIEEALQRGCRPFYIDNKQVGLIRGDFWVHLKKFSDVFVEVQSSSVQEVLKPGIHLHSDLRTYDERTRAVNTALETLRETNVINALSGWRHENYAVRYKYSDESLLEFERAGSGLFGFVQYGVHVNGFTKDPKGEMMMWIGRRSKTKQTFPDMFDNMCAGGLPAGMSIKDCVIKECQEEASVSDKILEELKFVGTLSYFYEDERGLFPECQFLYDLELPADFKPINADGEVGSFELVTLAKLKDLLSGDNFKPNCAAVCLDFLIRHGKLDPDTDSNCCSYLEQIHAPLQSVYS